jgi:hypothetical protein
MMRATVTDNEDAYDDEDDDAQADMLAELEALEELRRPLDFHEKAGVCQAPGSRPLNSPRFQLAPHLSPCFHPHC